MFNLLMEVNSAVSRKWTN